MTLFSPEISKYTISIHSTLISLLWNLVALVWAYVMSLQAMYTAGIELSPFFFFPSFFVNDIISKIINVSVTERLLQMGDQGAGLIILENVCIVYLFAFMIGLLFSLMPEKKNKNA